MISLHDLVNDIRTQQMNAEIDTTWVTKGQIIDADLLEAEKIGDTKEIARLRLNKKINLLDNRASDVVLHSTNDPTLIEEVNELLKQHPNHGALVAILNELTTPQEDGDIF